jgi:heme iron utilization protein
MDRSQIMTQLKDMFHSQLFGVLATTGEAGPYTSLVAFVATDDLRRLLFITSSSTSKFANIVDHPQVSMLVDNRSNQAGDVRAAIAVTVVGKACEQRGEERGDLLELFLRKHPNLLAFAHESSTALVEISVSRYILVSSFEEVIHIDMDNAP